MASGVSDVARDNPHNTAWRVVPTGTSFDIIADPDDQDHDIATVWTDEATAIRIARTPLLEHATQHVLELLQMGEIDDAIATLQEAAP